MTLKGVMTSEAHYLCDS